MKEYTSCGLGVNSMAMALVKPDSPHIFSDPGCEMPGTYEALKNWPVEVTVLHPKVKEKGVECSTIEEWCHKLGHAPLRAMRSCSDKWKHQPLEHFYEKPCIINLGIAYDEKHRATKTQRNTRGGTIFYKYPLVEQKVTREKCIDLIENAGFKVPPKSGCFFCPFQRKEMWIKLLREYPDLYERAMQVDELSKKVKCYDNGLRWLKGRIDLGLEQGTFCQPDPDDSWECQHCIII